MQNSAELHEFIAANTGVHLTHTRDPVVVLNNKPDPASLDLHTALANLIELAMIL